MQKPIAIIGGGPGGLFAAIRAAELGLKVVLYEKGKIGCGVKCAEGFIDTLGILGKPESGVLFKVERAIVFAGKEYHVHFLKDHGIWMIDRSIWQKSLSKTAQALGVSIKTDSPVEKNQLLVMLDTYSYIIDASGAPSVTSRLHGFVPVYLKNASLLTQYMIEGDFSFLGKNTIKTGYEPHYIGYYYIFPKGQNIANVGVGRFNLNRKNQGPHLKKELDRVLREEGIDGYRIQKEVHSFCPSCSVNKLVWGNILLVGSAAGLSSPLHGGGIDMACISGRLAAEHIASNQVPQYPTRLWNIVGKKITMEKRVLNLWKVFGHPFCLGILKHPGLLPAVVFNKPPLQKVLGFGAKRIF